MTTPPIPPPHQPPSPPRAIKGGKRAKPSETEKKTAEVAKRRSSAEESTPKRLTRSLSSETHILTTATLLKACKKNLLKDAERHLKQGASVKSVDSHQQTPLHIATAQADKDLVALLLTYLPDLTTQDIKGQTVAHIACRRGDSAICTLVCTLRNYRILDHDGCDAIHYLAKLGHHHAIKELGKKYLGHKLPMEFFHVSGPHRLNPLHVAASLGHWRAIRELALNCIRFSGIISHADYHGNTPLHHACRGDHLDCVTYLLGEKAPVDCLNHKLQTPLHVACENQAETVAIFLLNKGLDPYRFDNVGNHPAMLISQLGLTAVLPHVSEWYVTTNIPGRYDNRTLAHFAAAANQADLLRALIIRHPSLATQDDGDRATPLHLAAAANATATITLLLPHYHYKEVYTDTSGNTPLHIAGQHNHKEAFDLLVSAGFSTKQRNNERQTPQLAKKQQGQ